MNPGKKNVVIIGAGPSGLAALKAVLDSHEWRKGRWDVVALEAREEIGGIWCVNLKCGFFSGRLNNRTSDMLCQIFEWR